MDVALPIRAILMPMKRRIGIGLLYFLAVIVILGRIGSALDSQHPWREVIKLYPVTTGEAIGADLESLAEDALVIAAALHSWRLVRSFLLERKADGKGWRLNGWQRIGIIVSILWALGGGFWGNEIGLHQGDFAVTVERDCSEAPNANFAACEAQFDKDWSEAIKYHWYYAAFLGLVPIPLGWLSIYGVVGLVKWVRKGFTSPRQD